MQESTGTMGVLKLRGRMLWLVKDSIPVPEYLWKLVMDSTTGDSIVLVTLHNPYLQHLTRSITLCKDVCDQAGWGERLEDREVIGQGKNCMGKTKLENSLSEEMPRVKEGEQSVIFLIKNLSVLLFLFLSIRCFC